MEAKTCKVCGKSEPHVRFYVARRSLTCTGCENKARVARGTSQWLDAKPPEHRRRYARNAKYKARFGITLDDFERMEASQGGVCAVCGNPPDAWRTYLCVDHDHDTGVVRELLCDRCNRALGQVQDSVEVLEALIAYLRKHSA